MFPASKRLLRSLKLALLAFAVAGLAWGDDLKPQQQRMRACNTQADHKGLDGGARNHFLRSCLKGQKGDGHKLSAHQRRSEDCTRQARSQGLEGAERRGFMSECEKPPVKQQTAESEKMKSCARRADERRLSSEERERYLTGCRSAASAAAGS